MAAFADNAASQPGVTLVDSKAMGIRWNNNATQVAVWTGSSSRATSTPQGRDARPQGSEDRRDLGDATKFTITAFNNATGALDDADTDFGGDDLGDDRRAAAKTVQEGHAHPRARRPRRRRRSRVAELQAEPTARSAPTTWCCSASSSSTAASPDRRLGSVSNAPSSASS
jgi:hypothetical protein